MTTPDDPPPPESRGGWPRLARADAARERVGLDPTALSVARERHALLHAGDSFALVVVRHGLLALEDYSFNVLIPTRFDIWSATKSLTGTAWGLLLDDAREGRLPDHPALALETPAYDLIPAGHPLTDARKAAITVEQLLSMTSGIAGENAGIMGMPTRAEVGPFEHALGRAPNRFGRVVDRLMGEPGTIWDYSDPAIAHLALAFAHVAGQDLHPFLDERVLRSIGIENLSWDVQGGSGHLGPHTNAHTGVHVSARELARLGWLYARGGRWGERQLLPSWWVERAARSSQALNPRYGMTIWVNTDGGMWPSLPRDAFSFAGYRSNRCYVVPSLDLVVVRLGTGPAVWDEQDLIGRIVGAVVA